MTSLTQNNVTPELIAAYDFHRFMRKVEIGKGVGDCWEWRGNKPDGRYGHFSVRTKTVKAHRWIYERAVGPIPGGLVLRHKCDNPSCVNPMHLEIGTAADNTRDKFDRGRASDRKGERHPLARLTAHDVRALRRLASQGQTHQQLAAQFGVARQTVGSIVRGRNWGHIQ